ncbi:MAG: hypothetical protein AAFS10_21590 [Myxococcota bacterium]
MRNAPSTTCGINCDSCDSSQYCDGFECQPVVDGALRIEVRTDSRNVLQVYHDGIWRPVCDDGFGQQDAEVACRQFGGTLVRVETAVFTPTNSFWMDDLNCTGNEERLADCPFNGWGIEDCSSGEGISLQCELPTEPRPVRCNPAETSELLISEVYVPSSSSMQFVELSGPPRADLSNITLELFDPDANTPLTLQLPEGATMPLNGFYLFGGLQVAGRDLLLTGALPTELGAVVLKDCAGTVLDTFGYGDGDGVPVEGTRAPPLLDASFSWCRLTDEDTDDNATDFASCLNTAGVENVPSVRDTEFPLSETGTLDSADPSFNRANSDCSSTESGTFYYDTYVLDYAGPGATVDIQADWSGFDGYLLLYRGNLTPNSPLNSCAEGDDDFNGTVSSRVEGFSIADGERITVVMTTYSSSSTGSWTLTISEP